MFEAVKLLKGGLKRPEVAVEKSEGRLVFNEQEKANIVKDWFSEDYTGDEPPLAPFEGIPRALNTPISVDEVRTAAQKLKNNRAVGPDAIPNELLKYASRNFYERYSTLLNRCFEKHVHVDSFGQGYLTPLQKPRKPKGPLKSLRPLCLLNGTRKIMSM